uniref:Uncharacterized protein n=1 Tax=Chrysotila carterae TaxID=13221 RepID=A0A7S4C2X2_CHRCT
MANPADGPHAQQYSCITSDDAIGSDSGDESSLHSTYIDVLQGSLRRWRLLQGGRIRREWVTAAYTPAMHHMLSWHNTAQSQLELSIGFDMSDEEGIYATIRGDKPFTKEVVAGRSSDAVATGRRLIRSALKAALEHRNESVFLSSTLSVGSPGTYQPGPRWSIACGRRETWAELFDIDAIARDYDALVLPLMRSRHEHRLYLECWRGVARRWRQLKDLPVCSHLLFEAQDTLERRLTSTPKLTAKLFGQRRALPLRLFVKRLSRLCPDFSPAHLREFVRRMAPTQQRVVPLRGGWLPRRARPVRIRRFSVSAFIAHLATASRRLWDCWAPETSADLVLNGLLLGYALPSTAGHLIQQLTRREERLYGCPVSAKRLHRFKGSILTKELWEKLQPSRQLPQFVLDTPGESWTIEELRREKTATGQPCALLSMLRTQLVTFDGDAEDDFAGSEGL